MSGPVATRTYVYADTFALVLEPFALAKVYGSPVVRQNFQDTAKLDEEIAFDSAENKYVVHDDFRAARNDSSFRRYQRQTTLPRSEERRVV